MSCDVQFSNRRLPVPVFHTIEMSAGVGHSRKETIFPFLRLPVVNLMGLTMLFGG